MICEVHPTRDIVNRPPRSSSTSRQVREREGETGKNRKKRREVRRYSTEREKEGEMEEKERKIFIERKQNTNEQDRLFYSKGSG